MDVLAVLNEFSGVPIKAFPSRDIAVLNLVAAHGFSDLKDINPKLLLDKLDEWAERVQFEICRHLYRFDGRAENKPTEFTYGNSIARFFCSFLLQVLQEDCGVAYHPERKFNPDFCQPADLFIHGIVDENGKGGTCASMPVIYVAVARRLGLPVYLVSTKGHLFFRWDDPIGTLIEWKNPDLILRIPPDRFNVEGSGEGMAYRPDSYFVNWPEPWTDLDKQHGRYLKNWTTEEELAEFLVQRAECFYELGNWDECLKAMYFARKLAPDDMRFDWLHHKRTKQCEERNQSIDDMLDMVQQRKRQRQTVLGPNCHLPDCLCFACEEARFIARTGIPHGDSSCTCHACKEARATAPFPVGSPGHDATSCCCPTCLNARQNFENRQQMMGFLPSSMPFNPQPAIPRFPQLGFPALPNHRPQNPSTKNLPGF